MTAPRILTREQFVDALTNAATRHDLARVLEHDRALRAHVEALTAERDGLKRTVEARDMALDALGSAFVKLRDAAALPPADAPRAET